MPLPRPARARAGRGTGRSCWRTSSSTRSLISSELLRRASDRRARAAVDARRPPGPSGRRRAPGRTRRGWTRRWRRNFTRSSSGTAVVVGQREHPALKSSQDSSRFRSRSSRPRPSRPSLVKRHDAARAVHGGKPSLSRPAGTRGGDRPRVQSSSPSGRPRSQSSDDVLPLGVADRPAHGCAGTAGRRGGSRTRRASTRARNSSMTVRSPKSLSTSQCGDTGPRYTTRACARGGSTSGAGWQGGHADSFRNGPGELTGTARRIGGRRRRLSRSPRRASPAWR